MPFELFWSGSCLTITVSGDFGDEALGITDTFMRAPRFSSIDRVFADLAGVERFTIEGDSVRSIASRQSDALHSRRHIKVALLVSQPVAVGIARMWQNYLGVYGDHSWSIRIFEDRDRAVEWLDLS